MREIALKGDQKKVKKEKVSLDQVLEVVIEDWKTSGVPEGW